MGKCYVVKRYDYDTELLVDRTGEFLLGGPIIPKEVGPKIVGFAKDFATALEAVAKYGDPERYSDQLMREENKTKKGHKKRRLFYLDYDEDRDKYIQHLETLVVYPADTILGDLLV